MRAAAGGGTPTAGRAHHGGCLSPGAARARRV